MAKSTIILFALVVLTICVNLSHQQCPPSSKVTMCAPKCIEDSQCASSGKKCCPNICNLKSCVFPSGNSASSGDKYASTGAGGSTYCGNAKCSSYEKCDAKKNRCVRT